MVATDFGSEGNSNPILVDFNKEEIEKLKNLLGLLEKTFVAGTCSLVFLRYFLSIFIFIDL